MIYQLNEMTLAQQLHKEYCNNFIYFTISLHRKIKLTGDASKTVFFFNQSNYSHNLFAYSRQSTSTIKTCLLNFFP